MVVTGLVFVTILLAGLMLLGAAALVTAILLQLRLRRRRSRFPHLNRNWQRSQRYIAALFVISGLLLVAPPALVVFSVSSSFASNSTDYYNSYFDPLCQMVSEGDQQQVYEELQGGADPNSIDYTMDATPLLIACQYSDVDMAELLLENGANPNLATPRFQETPLMYATGHVELTRMLLEAGADPNAVDQQGMMTPLVMACYNLDAIESAQLLLENGALVNQPVEDGMTALLLLSCTKENYSPELIDAQRAFIELFVDAGADLTAQNTFEEMTAYDYALVNMEEWLAAGAVPADQMSFYESTKEQILALLTPTLES